MLYVVPYRGIDDTARMSLCIDHRWYCTHVVVHWPSMILLACYCALTIDDTAHACYCSLTIDDTARMLLRIDHRWYCTHVIAHWPSMRLHACHMPSIIVESHHHIDIVMISGSCSFIDDSEFRIVSSMNPILQHWLTIIRSSYSCIDCPWFRIVPSMTPNSGVWLDQLAISNSGSYHRSLMIPGPWACHRIWIVVSNLDQRILHLRSILCWIVPLLRLGPTSIPSGIVDKCTIDDSGFL